MQYQGWVILLISEEASENAILASLKSAVEMYAMDQVVANSNKSYPFNPFDDMEKTPEGYTGKTVY